jgi:hypothetical protein
MTRLVTILVLVVALIGGGCGSSTPAPSSSPSASPSATATVAATTLYAAFAKHQAAALQLYKGKVLQVTGAVLKTDTDPVFQAPEVVLAGSSGAQGRGIDCIFAPGDASAVKKVSKGQSFTVRGTCEGFAVNVLLLHCQPAP